MKTLETLDTYQAGSIILVDKPLEWTSFDIVKYFRKPLNCKIGHCGTLDPLATGLLILCTGKKTKDIQQYMNLPKRYTGTFTLGHTTPTYDLESTPIFTGDYTHIDIQACIAMTEKFIGEIYQKPPIHSAIKKDGKRLYEMARAGQEIEVEPRLVKVHQFNIVSLKDNLVAFDIICSAGTYIRSMAQDFGQALGCGAYLSSLRREQIGDFDVKDAVTPKAFMEHIHSIKKAQP
jgi:tRNA pseudouridine55 synthase